MKNVTRKPTNIFCVSQIVPTSLSLFLFRAFIEGAGSCAGLWAGFDARQASEADLTWQSHYKNRAISQCYALANYQKKTAA